MPILEVEVVTDAGEALDQDLARRLADAAGEVLGAGAGRCWVRLRELPRQRYAENGGPLDPALRPVFVSLLLADWPSPEERRALLRQLAAALADACGRPAENLHLLLQPPARGRVAFGGELVD